MRTSSLCTPMKAAARVRICGSSSSRRNTDAEATPRQRSGASGGSGRSAARAERAGRTIIVK
eukprot:6173692-Pleurochrysis_carterae.AAC.10